MFYTFLFTGELVHRLSTIYVSHSHLSLLTLQFVNRHGPRPHVIGTDIVVFTCVFTLPFRSGLSPDLQSMEQIRRIMRPTDVPDQGLLCDLLWSDPDKDVLGWGENDRGVSFTFGSEVVAKFLHKHDLDLICRAHQVITHIFCHYKFSTYVTTVDT